MWVFFFFNVHGPLFWECGHSFVMTLIVMLYDDFSFIYSVLLSDQKIFVHCCWAGFLFTKIKTKERNQNVNYNVSLHKYLFSILYISTPVIGLMNKMPVAVKSIYVCVVFSSLYRITSQKNSEFRCVKLLLVLQSSAHTWRLSHIYNLMRCLCVQ